MITQKEVGIYYDNEAEAHIVVVDNDEYVCSSLPNAVRVALRYQASSQEIACDSSVDAGEVNQIIRSVHQERLQSEWARGYNRRTNGRFSHVDR
jgi:hypothetical protein